MPAPPKGSPKYNNYMKMYMRGRRIKKRQEQISAVLGENFDLLSGKYVSRDEMYTMIVFLHNRLKVLEATRSVFTNIVVDQDTIDQIEKERLELCGGR